MQTSLIIPTLNEEESISHVLAAVPKSVVTELIVVDGGSSDKTVSLAIKAGARVVHELSRGYGYACAAGLRYAKGEIVVFMDADGSDDPSQIPNLVAPLKTKEADLVLGSRLAGEIEKNAMLYHQKFGNQLSSWLIKLFYGLPITDLSPFRASYRKKILDLDMQEMTYGWPTEMIVKAARYGWVIKEIPVTYSPRIGGKSKISGTIRGTILATYHILATIFRYSVR
jgi:glycosyltransferase involved in cell wall biosynthesis